MLGRAMTTSPITYFTLDNGLRCVHYASRGNVDYCGAVIGVGSRDELPEQYGLAHFVEHTIFKGTTTRRSHHIINRMEAVGGELNAYTTKEETAVYTVAPSGYLSRAAELLADLINNSVFPADELDCEREVVADEINSYLDSPADAVFDDFDELMFASTPLAHNILGSVSTLRTFTSGDCRHWLDRYYVPGNMVLCYAGRESVGRVQRVLSKYFGAMGGEKPQRPQCAMPSAQQFGVTRPIDLHQAHTVLGARVGDMFAPERHALALLTNILGGPGMNSLLNVSLREKRGLVYTVEASLALLTDAGMFSVYFGCDPGDVDRCVALSTRQIERLADAEMSATALARAKRQYIGQLQVSCDNIEQMALSAARATLFHGSASTIDTIAERINALTPSQLREAAASLLPLSRLTLC